MQSLQKISLTALLGCLFCLSLLAETRHIHVIQMLDDNSYNYVVSEGARSIGYGVERKVQQIKQELGITTVHYYYISGTSFTRAKLDEVMEYELAYQERDIILLVYAGHGYREPGSLGHFPKLYFNNYAEGLELEDLRLALLQKNPSLLISLVMACNVTQYDRSVPPIMPEDGNPPPVASLTPKAVNTQGQRAFEHLFADQPGYTKVVDLLSADRENFTFISRDGGIFFSEVQYVFQEIFHGGNYRGWNDVCNTIRERTTLRSQERNLMQQPFCNYEIYVSSAAEVVDRSPTQSECRRMARTLRQDQKRQLKQLRRHHREQLRSLSRGYDYRNQKKILAATQRQEKANLQLVQLQNYQRSLAGCR